MLQSRRRSDRWRFAPIWSSSRTICWKAGPRVARLRRRRSGRSGAIPRIRPRARGRRRRLSAGFSARGRICGAARIVGVARTRGFQHLVRVRHALSPEGSLFAVKAAIDAPMVVVGFGVSARELGYDDLAGKAAIPSCARSPLSLPRTSTALVREPQSAATRSTTAPMTMLREPRHSSRRHGCSRTVRDLAV